MHGVVVSRFWRWERGTSEGCTGVWGFGLGIWKKNARGMSDMWRKYLVPIGYNDKLKKLFMTINTRINDGLLFLLILPLRSK
jgi:hypothetical protein